MGYKRDQRQVEKFAKEYIANGFNGKTAMAEISPELNPKALSLKKSRWIHSPEVINEIDRQIQLLGITPEKIRSIIRARLLKILIEDISKDSDAIQGASMLAKLEGLLKDDTNSNTLAIFGDVLGELKAVSVKSMPKEVVIEPPIEPITPIIPQKLDTNTA